MNEIIEKLKSAYNDLVVLKAQAEAQLEENSKEAKDLYLDRVSLSEAEESLKKREEAVKPIEDIVRIKAQIDHTSQVLADQKASFLKEKASYEIAKDSFIKEHSSKVAELERLQDVFKKKSEDLDKKLAEVAEEKKNIRANVLAELKALV